MEVGCQSNRTGLAILPAVAVWSMIKRMFAYTHTASAEQEYSRPTDERWDPFRNDQGNLRQAVVLVGCRGVAPATGRTALTNRLVPDDQRSGVATPHNTPTEERWHDEQP